MEEQTLFPRRPEVTPSIYAYEDKYNPNVRGMLKVGMTGRDVALRIREQHNIATPGGATYRIVMTEPSMRSDGTVVTDHEVRALLARRGHHGAAGTEWVRCTADDVRSAVLALRERKEYSYGRTQTFGMRPEQREAVEKTAAYFEQFAATEKRRTPHFLWNCKMRFGKTFATYQLARRMEWRRVLVLTFKPAVAAAWEEDLATHCDFEGWQFYNARTMSLDALDRSRPFVCFGSFQDFLGRNKAGGLKAKHQWTLEFNWDCIVLDEYHYGAWREGAQELIGNLPDDRELREDEQADASDDFDEAFMPLTARAYLYLSGTPFRALASGDFIEEEIYNWTYADEQRAKAAWTGPAEANPYADLPRMVLLTYQLPPSIAHVAEEGVFDEFDLNTFFRAEGEGAEAEFVHRDEVQKWLDLLRGANVSEVLAAGASSSRRPMLPFLDSRLLGALSHTLWFLPSVAACHAMARLLGERQNAFYHDYEVVVCAGTKAGIGQAALPPVLAAMERPDPLRCRSITLTCGKLTTGVTVRPWTGIFMLRDTSSPETYFQAAFRVQSPWTVADPDDARRRTVVKPECYVFDFSPNRALRKMADYATQLSAEARMGVEQKVAELLHFLPVLCYQDGAMTELDATGVLDMATSNTSATLLARRWESATLVHVENAILQRLLDSPEAMAALTKIEGFRSLNADLQTIISKSDKVKKIKKRGDNITKGERKDLSDEEKQIKSLRRQIQEKLIKFATRIPVFMYLTDFREEALEDVIMQLEPGLFVKVTGLEKKDFELLVSLGVFDRPKMNDAVFKFKRYEDASLTYTGIDRHADDAYVGGMTTRIPRREFYSQT